MREKSKWNKNMKTVLLGKEKNESKVSGKVGTKETVVSIC